MALRTTRQYVEVLMTGTGKVRATRQYVEVLARLPIPTSGESLTSTLSLASTVAVTQVKSIVVTTAMSLASTAVGGKIYTKIAGNTLSLGQDVYRTHTADSALALTQSVVCQRVRFGNADSVITVGQTVSVVAIHNVAVSNAIQTITEVYDPVTESMVDVIDGLNDSVGASRIAGAPNGIHHVIPLTSSVNVVLIKSGAIDVSVSNAITLSQGLFQNQVGDGINTIQLGQTLQVDFCKPVTSALSLNNSVVPVVYRSRTASSALTLGQSVAFVIQTIGILTQYHPFVGAGASGPPLTLGSPMPGITAQFQLVFPAAGVVTDSVTLRSPDFGNKDQLSFNRISRETRGGSLIVFADPSWPKIQTLVLSFSALHRNEAQALLTFLDTYLGQEVGLIDWEQRYWKGIVVSPENPVIEDSRDSFSASFNFEGEMDPTWTPQVIPVLQGTPLRRVLPQFSTYCEQEEPVPIPVVPVNTYYAEADETMLAGQVVYVESNGHVDLAKSDDVATMGAVGLLFAGVAIGATATYLTEGSITLSDWTAITGTVTLTPGALYWLSNSVDGGLTTTAPSTGYVVQIGRAVSATTFDIEVQESIKL